MAWHPFRNLGLKCLAVVLGTLLWFIVGGEFVVERRVQVALEFRNIPASLELTGTPPSTVDARLRGTSGQLSRIGRGDVVAYVDLNGAQPGMRLFTLRTDQVTAPAGVQVEQVFPAALALELERSGVLTVPVVPVIEGEPADGYVRGAVTVEPATVEVVGPESRLKQLRSAITEPVSIAGAKTTVQKMVGIGVTDAALRVRQTRDAKVTVVIK
jgi:YbbR domain-containing protein